MKLELLKHFVKSVGKCCYESAPLFFWTWGILLGIYGAILHDSRPALAGSCIFMLGTGFKLESTANREFWKLHALYTETYDLLERALKEIERLRSERK